jgi:hypothetical protein
VPAFAARLTPQLERELARLARAGLTPAEITRRIGDAAQEQGLPRPSYARVRQLVLEQPIGGRAEPSWGQLLLDVDLQRRSPQVLLQKWAGTLPMDEDAGLR